MRVFGERRLSELHSPAIAAWRMTIPPGHRFEATQALRQVLARAVSWGLLDVNPAKLGVENPQRRYTEKRPFDSWDELYALVDRLGPRHGPMVLFAAATGLRPGEWLALEHRDVDREAQVVYVRRTFRNGRIKPPKTKASVRAVPLQAIALAALAMIDRHYGHLARDGREHAIRLLDSYKAAGALDVHAVYARWTLNDVSDAAADNGKGS